MNLREIKLREALGKFAVHNVDRLKAEVIVKVKRFLGLLPSQPQFNSVHWLYLMVLQLPSQTHHLFSLRLSPMPPCTTCRFRAGDLWVRLKPTVAFWPLLLFQTWTCESTQTGDRGGIFWIPWEWGAGFSETCSESTPLLQQYGYRGDKQEEIHCFNL